MKNWLFSKMNYTLFGVSAALLFLGYVLLGQGPADNGLSKTVAPIILFVVYCGLIPFSILCGFGKDGGSGDGKAVNKKGV